MKTTDVSPNELCVTMLTLIKQFKAAIAELAESHGLTTIQLGALHAINEGHATMGRVAQTMHCDASNVTGIVDRLVQLQLVTRQEDASDRRVKSLALTQRGRNILDGVQSIMPERLGCTKLTAHERADLHGLLAKIVGGGSPAYPD